jgi:hypothetical protein
MDAPRAGQFRDIRAVYSLCARFQISGSHSSCTRARGGFWFLVCIALEVGSRNKIRSKLRILFPPNIICCVNICHLKTERKLSSVTNKIYKAVELRIAYCRDSISKYATTAFCHIPSHSPWFHNTCEGWHCWVIRLQRSSGTANILITRGGDYE